MTRLATPTSNPMPRLNDGTAIMSRPYTPFPRTMTNDKIQCPLLMRLPSYHKIHSHDHSPASNVTTPTMQMPYAPLLSRTSPQLWNYSTMMREHQSTWRVMSLGLHLAPDSSLYDKKQGLATPTKSWGNAPIVKALLIHLLNAPLLSKVPDHHRHKREHCPSPYQSLRKARPQTSILIIPSNPYQRGQGNLGPN